MSVEIVTIDRSAPARETEPVGDSTLCDVYDYLGRFVSYPIEHAHVAHVLWIAHAHLMEKWDSTPRLAFLSPEPGSGKSRALEVTAPLAPNPVHAVNTSPAYLFRKVADPDGAPTILFDEIDTVFGPKARENEELRGLLNAGHRKGAVAGRCVVRGKEVFTEELPAYCAVALAGLGGLPDTILSRAIVIRMRRRAPNERVEQFRQRLHEPEGREIGERLAAWCAANANRVRWPELPPQIQDRAADVWEPLLAVADLAGGDWPQRARVAAVALVADSRQGSPSLGILLLSDLRDVFDIATALPTETILERLHRIEESPWADLRGKPLDARGLSHRLRQYGIKPVNIYIQERTSPKGYKRADLLDAWSRYLPPSPEKSATSATSATAAPLLALRVADTGPASAISATSGATGDSGVADVADVREANPDAERFSL